MRYLLFLLLPFSSLCQEFPKNWEGSYEGNLIIGVAHRPNDTVGVLFEMQPIIADSVWSYKTTFNSKRYGLIVKDYLLVRNAAGNSIDFVLDEQNGILMEMTYLNGTLYGMYEVLGQLYITTGRMIDGQLYLDLFAAGMKTPLITHSQDDPETEAADSIEAKSYKPLLHQTSLLTRIP